MKGAVEEQFTLPEVTKAIGTDPGRFREWVNSDYILPSEQRAAGPGVPHLFSREDAYGAGLFKLLVADLKVSRKLSAAYVKGFLKDLKNIPIDYIFFRVVEGKIKATTFDERIAQKYKLDIPTTWFCSPMGRRVLPDVTGRDPGGPPVDPDINWDYAIVINFKKIRQEIDGRL